MVGYLIALALGMEHVTAIYVAVALTLWSTIIGVAVSASARREAEALRREGANRVFVSYADVAQEAADKLWREIRHDIDAQVSGGVV